LYDEFVRFIPNHQPGGPGFDFCVLSQEVWQIPKEPSLSPRLGHPSSGSSVKACPILVNLPVATLLPILPQEHANLLAQFNTNLRKSSAPLEGVNTSSNRLKHFDLMHISTKIQVNFILA
jgi:hypothetical protein